MKCRSSITSIDIRTRPLSLPEDLISLSSGWRAKNHLNQRSDGPKLNTGPLHEPTRTTTKRFEPLCTLGMINSAVPGCCTVPCHVALPQWRPAAGRVSEVVVLELVSFADVPREPRRHLIAHFAVSTVSRIQILYYRWLIIYIHIKYNISRHFR